MHVKVLCTTKNNAIIIVITMKNIIGVQCSPKKVKVHLITTTTTAFKNQAESQTQKSREQSERDIFSSHLNMGRDGNTMTSLQEAVPKASSSSSNLAQRYLGALL